MVKINLNINHDDDEKINFLLNVDGNYKSLVFDNYQEFRDYLIKLSSEYEFK